MVRQAHHERVGACAKSSYLISPLILSLSKDRVVWFDRLTMSGLGSLLLVAVS